MMFLACSDLPMRAGREQAQFASETARRNGCSYLCHILVMRWLGEESRTSSCLPRLKNQGACSVLSCSLQSYACICRRAGP
jgi:hypothetical protein